MNDQDLSGGAVDLSSNVDPGASMTTHEQDTPSSDPANAVIKPSSIPSASGKTIGPFKDTLTYFQNVLYLLEQQEDRGHCPHEDASYFPHFETLGTRVQSAHFQGTRAEKDWYAKEYHKYGEELLSDDINYFFATDSPRYELRKIILAAADAAIDDLEVWFNGVPEDGKVRSQLEGEWRVFRERCRFGMSECERFFAL